MLRVGVGAMPSLSVAGFAPCSSKIAAQNAEPVLLSRTSYLNNLYHVSRDYKQLKDFIYPADPCRFAGRLPLGQNGV